jgi:hypothetical protein
MKQMRMVGRIVLYVVHALSKEIMRFILPRTSCFSMLLNDDFSREYIQSDGKMSDQWRSVLVLKEIKPGHLPGGTEEKHK